MPCFKTKSLGFLFWSKAKAAIKKHGKDDFIILILKVLTFSDLITLKRLVAAEDRYLMKLFTKWPKALYNVLKRAHSSLGYKHTQAAKLKIRVARLGCVTSKQKSLKAFVCKCAKQKAKAFCL